MCNDRVVVFGTPHCGACMMFKQKLERAKAEFSYTTDAEQLAIAVEASGLMQAPIVKIGDSYFNATEAAKYLKI